MKIIKESFKEEPKILTSEELDELGYKINGSCGCFAQGTFNDGIEFDLLSDSKDEGTKININDKDTVLKVNGCNTQSQMFKLLLELGSMSSSEAQEKYPLVLDESNNLKSEDTVKNKKGKWVNKGKEGTHGEFDTKKQADAQRRAMYANGFKEEISDEDMKHQKENEDTINLMEEILVSIDNAVHTLKNRVYYGGSFESNITDLEQSCNKMIKFSKELKEY